MISALCALFWMVVVNDESHSLRRSSGQDQVGADRNAIIAETFVVRERGRWVVYLAVHFWEADHADLIRTVERRIADYATQRQAEVAARWYERVANRDLGQLPLGL